VLVKYGEKCYFSDWPEPQSFHDVKLYSDTVGRLTEEEMVSACEEMTSGFVDYEKDLYTAAAACRSEVEAMLLTSSGIDITVPSSYWSLSGYAQRTEGTDMLQSFASRSWRRIEKEKFVPKKIVSEVVEDLENGRRTAKLSSGSYPAYLTPYATSRLLLGPLSIGISGSAVEKGGSPLKGRLGEKIFADVINVEDNPFIDYGPDSGVLDSDGVATSRKNIVENGVLKTFLYDWNTAAMAKAAPTGNSDCCASNYIVRPGAVSKQDLIGSIEKGIVLDNFIGLGQGNFGNGDFSCNVALGFLVENGEITGRVKDTMVSGNIYDLFKKNVVVAKDCDWSGEVPGMLVDGVNVSSKH